MNKIFLVFLLLISLSCSKEDIAIDDTQETDVIETDTLSDTDQDVRIDVLSQVNRNFLDRQAVFVKLSVKDGDLAKRDITVRVTPSDIAPVGALILTTSGFGGGFYGRNEQKNATIDFALSNGLQVLEVRWDGEYGWGTDVDGEGYTRALRAYTKIVEWLKANEITNTSLIISHGGSGGAMQIAYGLANFNLEETIDYAILTAGPPTSDLDRAIYGTPTDKAAWPDGLLGFSKTDYIQGWKGEGDYCANRSVNPPDFVIETLEAESIINNSSTKDYDYGSTKLYFINTNDITNSDEQGLLYYNMVESPKEWIFLSQENAHDVGGLEVGAMRIRQVLNEIINN